MEKMNPASINAQALFAMQALQQAQSQIPSPPPLPVAPQPSAPLPVAPEPMYPAAQPDFSGVVQPVQVVRRNLTVAEMIVLLLASTLLLGGIQTIWNVAPKPIVNIEWRR
jgi:hypothetical protein